MSWNVFFTGGFSQLLFTDSLRGYRAAAGFFRTTNGGMNWSKDSLPNILVNTYTNKWISVFTKTVNNTFFCSGGYVYYYGNGRYKATIYKTTNGGLNWGYQIPDTSYNLFTLDMMSIINKNNLWLYTLTSGVYSSTGGDSTIYLGVRNISNEIPVKYEIYQNYPNPFNSMTNIKFQDLNSEQIRISIYDITGKELAVLVDEKLKPGTYETRYDGSGLSSGVYFCRLTAEDKAVQTRKMVMLK